MKAILKSLCTIVLVSTPAMCGLSGSLQLAQILQQADQVVVATAESLIEGPPLTIKLNVSRSVKGDVKSGTVVQVTWSSASLSTGIFRRPVEGVSLRNRLGIWFLKQNDSALSVIPLFAGDVGLDDLYIPGFVNICKP